MRNDPSDKTRVVYLCNREANAINGDRSFFHDVTRISPIQADACKVAERLQVDLAKNPSFKAVCDEDANSLVVEVLVAKRPIARLDVPVVQTVVPLKHADAKTVEQTLRQQPLGPDVRISADERTNTITISATERQTEEIRLLLMRLDAPDSPLR